MPRALDSSSAPITDTGDPVVETKNVDVLLTKYAASGPQEEPDPTTNAIMEWLVPQLSKWFQREFQKERVCRRYHCRNYSGFEN